MKCVKALMHVSIMMRIYIFFYCSSFILLALRKIKIVTFLEQQVTSLPKLR